MCSFLFTVLVCIFVSAVPVSGYGYMGSVKLVHANYSDSFESIQASFGPDYGWSGYSLTGVLVFVRPHNACQPEIEPKAHHVRLNTTTHVKIALIERGECNYDKKVLHVQRAGYDAAIVFNTYDDGLVVMSSGSKRISDQITILSVYIGRTGGEILRHWLADSGAEVEIVVDGFMNLYFYLIPFASVIGTCFLCVALVMCARWCHSIRRDRNNRLTKRHLKKLPIKKFKKSTDAYDTCAICLEDYVDGEKLRLLPCNHAFHQACVDPWLLSQKRSCPCCKRHVIGRPSNQARNVEESNSDDERRPLLSRSPTEDRRYVTGLPDDMPLTRDRGEENRATQPIDEEEPARPTAVAEVIVERPNDSSGPSASGASNDGQNVKITVIIK